MFLKHFTEQAIITDGQATNFFSFIDKLDSFE